MAADAGWQAFDMLIRHPGAMAYQLFTALQAGSPLPPLQELPDECVALLLYLVRTAPPLSSHEAAVAAEARSRGLAEFDAAGYVEPPDELTTVLDAASAVLLRQWQAGGPPDPRTWLRELSAAEATVDALPADLPPVRLQEIASVRVDLARAAARIHTDLGDKDAASAAWHRALGAARPIESLLLSTVRRYCEWIGRSDPDEALQQFLPLVERVLSGPPDIQRAEMLTYLTRFYLNHGDAIAAQDMGRRLERELQRLGFADNASGDYLDALPVWVSAAQRHVSDRTGALAAVHSALTGWLMIHALHVQLGTGDDSHQDRMGRLGVLFEEMSTREQAAEVSDGELLAAAAAMPDATPSLVAPDFSAGRAADERFRALCRRYDAGENSDELVEGWRSLAADPDLVPSSRAWSAVRAAKALTDRQLWDAARPDLRSALALARSAHEHDAEILAWHLLIQEQVTLGDNAAASHLCGQAIDRVEEVRSRITAPYLESAFMTALCSPYILGIETARRCGDWQLMLERTELIRTRALQSPASRVDSDGPLLAELRQLSAEFVVAANRDDRRLQRQAIWERLLIGRQQRRPRFDLATLQRRISGRAVVLGYYFLAESTLLRLCITGDSVLCEKVSVEEHPAFIAALDGLACATAGSEDVERHLSALAPELLPPAFAAEVDAAPQVIVCPHQALHQVPFAALPFAGATLIEHKPVGAVPNLTCLLAEPAPPSSTTAYFGIATRSASDENGESKPALPGVEREIRQAAKLFGTPSRTLLGSAVTRENVDSADLRASLGSARVVHLALHGSDVADADVANAPMETKLYLADGPVDGLDIITWSLTADVVVLSACHAGKRAVSARGLARLSTDTVYGLQAAFHQAGAKAVIGPLWAVSDRVAPELIKPLCVALRDGHDAASALQHAVRTYLGGTVGTWRSPSLWGSFTLVGFSPAAFGLSPPAS